MRMVSDSSKSKLTEKLSSILKFMPELASVHLRLCFSSDGNRFQHQRNSCDIKRVLERCLKHLTPSCVSHSPIVLNTLLSATDCGISKTNMGGLKIPSSFLRLTNGRSTFGPTILPLSYQRMNKKCGTPKATLTRDCTCMFQFPWFQTWEQRSFLCIPSVRLASVFSVLI